MLGTGQAFNQALLGGLRGAAGIGATLQHALNPVEGGNAQADKDRRASIDDFFQGKHKIRSRLRFRPDRPARKSRGLPAWVVFSVPALRHWALRLRWSTPWGRRDSRPGQERLAWWAPSPTSRLALRLVLRQGPLRPDS